MALFGDTAAASLVGLLGSLGVLEAPLTYTAGPSIPLPWAFNISFSLIFFIKRFKLGVNWALNGVKTFLCHLMLRKLYLVLGWKVGMDGVNYEITIFSKAWNLLIGKTVVLYNNQFLP